VAYKSEIWKLDKLVVDVDVIASRFYAFTDAISGHVKCASEM